MLITYQMHFLKYFILTTCRMSNSAALHAKFNYLSAVVHKYFYILSASKATLMIVEKAPLHSHLNGSRAVVITSRTPLLLAITITIVSYDCQS